MHFNYVDIGTSNFDTSIKNKTDNDTVLLIEPLKFYLDDLPDGIGIFKGNYAISDENFNTKIFYLHPTDIEKYNLPSGFKGCNSINKKHPTVLRYLKELGISEEVIQCQDVSVISFKELVNEFKIETIGRLKIDTEGHDHIILKSVLSYIKETNLYIKEIVFEYEISFGNTEVLDTLVEDFKSVGFAFRALKKNNKIIVNTK